MSLDYLISKWPGEDALGTSAEVIARVKDAVGVVLADKGSIAVRDGALRCSFVEEDGVVAMIMAGPDGNCAPRKPQFLGDWMALLQQIALALDAKVIDAQNGVPTTGDDDDVPAPERADDFVIVLMPIAGPDGKIGNAREIWASLARLGISHVTPEISGDGWRLRVGAPEVGPARRIELHLSWDDVARRTALLERCATINDGNGWVAIDPTRDDVFPLDWFLA
jgi:hypothetical protein